MNHSDRQIRDATALQAAEWFIAHQQGDLSSSQRDAFIHWLRASPENVREYLAMAGMAKDVAHATNHVADSAEELLAQARLDAAVAPLAPGRFADARGHIRELPVARTRSRRYWAAGIATVVLIGIGSMLALWRSQEGVYSTAHAEQRSWRLSDGSTVHLNSASTVRVRFEEDRRVVELARGQAVFHVASDPARPFWVDAGEAVVKAIGTEFDIYRRPQGTVISVMEGRIAVWRRDREAGTDVLLPREPGRAAALPAPVAHVETGQQVVLRQDSVLMATDEADVRKAVAWLQRQVIFDQDSLADVVDEFNRYNELRIEVSDAQLRQTEVSGIFSAYDTESFIRFLEDQPDMRVVRERERVVVMPAGSLR